MTEGSFPKVSGDILYASEINGLVVNLGIDKTSNAFTQDSLEEVYALTISAADTQKYEKIIVQAYCNVSTNNEDTDGYMGIYLDDVAKITQGYQINSVINALHMGGFIQWVFVRATDYTSGVACEIEIKGISRDGCSVTYKGCRIDGVY